MDGPFTLSSLFAPPATTRKRTHNQISTPSIRQPSCSVREAEGPITDARSFGIDNLRMPAIHRFRGDGLDMRRPIMSTQPPQSEAQDVIDLTEEPPSPVFAPQSNVHPLNRRGPPQTRMQRGPRYEREIIDADASAGDVRESSPEVQFIRARPRSPGSSGPSHISTANAAHLPSLRMFPAGLQERLHGRATALQSMTRFMPDIGALMGARNARAQDELVQIEDWHLGGFEAPDLNFGLQGFNLDQPSRPIDQPPRFPMYDAPPPARAGFTRELKEDELLICANCDDELGAGDDDEKRQVWIIKACGHVYCGECAKNRSASSKNVSPSRRSKPFKKCMVEACGKNTSRYNMIQVYL